MGLWLGLGLDSNPNPSPNPIKARLPDHKAQQRPAPAAQPAAKATAAPREPAPTNSAMVPHVRHPAGL